MHKAIKLAPALLLTTLFGCGLLDGGDDGGGGAPNITSFTANPTTITAGQSATLSWTVTGSPTSLEISGVGSVSGTSTTVTPTATTTYTLTASNASGSDNETATVTVSGTTPPPPPPGGERTLSFGVSASQTGPFEGDADSNITGPTDPRVLNVDGGDTFYAQVVYSGPAPVTDVTIYLANSSPAGFAADLVEGQEVNGFTLGAPLPGCTVDGTATSVSCIYPIAVSPGTQNITGLPGVSGEFAYVLRSQVTDTSGEEPYRQPPRGYVIVGDAGSGTTTGGTTTGGTTGTTTGGTTSGTTTGGTTTGGTDDGGTDDGGTDDGGTDDGGTDDGGTDDGTTTSGTTTGGTTGTTTGGTTGGTTTGTTTGGTTTGTTTGGTTTGGTTTGGTTGSTTGSTTGGTTGGNG